MVVLDEEVVVVLVEFLVDQLYCRQVLILLLLVQVVLVLVMMNKVLMVGHLQYHLQMEPQLLQPVAEVEVDGIYEMDEMVVRVGVFVLLLVIVLEQVLTDKDFQVRVKQVIMLAVVVVVHVVVVLVQPVVLELVLQ